MNIRSSCIISTLNLIIAMCNIGTQHVNAQIHINGGAKYYHLRGSNEFFTGTVELEILNSIGTGFGATVQYGKDKFDRNYISFDPVSLVCGLGLFINYAKMNKMIKQLEDEYDIDREQAISILHENGTYRSMMEGNKATAILAMAGNTKTDLKSIVIPASVEEIDDNAFEGCTNLTDVIIEGHPEPRWETTCSRTAPTSRASSSANQHSVTGQIIDKALNSFN